MPEDKGDFLKSMLIFNLASFTLNLKLYIFRIFFLFCAL